MEKRATSCVRAYEFISEEDRQEQIKEKIEVLEGFEIEEPILIY